MPSQTRYDLFIDGSWTKPASGERTQIRNPATGDVVGEAAQKAFPAWRDTPASKRADALYKLRDLVARDKETLARTITSEMGKTLKEAQGEVDFAIALLRFAAENTRRLEGEIIPGERPGEKILIDRVPHGIVGAIAAWNFPLALCARKIAPAIAAGNTIVLKPHELIPTLGCPDSYLISLGYRFGSPCDSPDVEPGRHPNGQSVGIA